MKTYRIEQGTLNEKEVLIGLVRGCEWTVKQYFPVRDTKAQAAYKHELRQLMYALRTEGAVAFRASLNDLLSGHADRSFE